MAIHNNILINFFYFFTLYKTGWNRIKGGCKKLFDLDREDEILRARKLRKDRLEAMKKAALEEEAGYCSSDEDSFDVETERTFVQFLRGGLIAL